jgi:hypothetical protein
MRYIDWDHQDPEEGADSPFIKELARESEMLRAKQSQISVINQELKNWRYEDDNFWAEVEAREEQNSKHYYENK